MPTRPRTPRSPAIYGAEGIGLFRTEHMFYGKGSDEPLFVLRKMILSNTKEERQAAVDELFPFVKKSIKGTLEAMNGLPVTVRLLDPPLHEFVPQDKDAVAQLAEALKIKPADIKKRGEALHEVNPMMGHRGIRLGITYPEVTEMQIKAIFEAAAELIKEGKDAKPEIMVPVTCDVKEIDVTKVLVDRVHAEVKAGHRRRREVSLRHDDRDSAGLLAGRSDGEDGAVLLLRHQRPHADDLRLQPRRHRRLPAPIPQGRHPRGRPLPDDRPAGRGPVDQDGGGEGPGTKHDLKVGICGEQGGDPASVEFCFKTGLNYVSCSPYRVPIARLAAAHAAIKAKGK